MARTKQRTRLQDFLVTSGDELRGEDATTAGGTGSSVPITAGDNPVVAASGAGGDVVLTSGSVTDAGSTGNAGSVILTPGTAAGAGTDGSIVLNYATWPLADGSLGDVLTTDGSGGLSWAAAAGASGLAQSGVITEDLRFFIDFNNQSSWEPNQTTTWTDTIASVSGTVSGPTIVGGHLNFAAGTDVVGFGVLPTALEDLFAGGGTVCAWVRVESDGGGNFGHIVDTRGVGSSEGWVLFTRDEGVGDDYQFSLQVQTSAGGPNAWETTDRPFLNQWVFIALTFDSDSVTTAPVMYLDGESVSVTTITDTGTGYVSDAGNDLLVGNRDAGDRGFDGDIEIVALYDEVKSAAEIRDIYRAQSSRFGSLRGELSSDRATDVRILGADTTSSSEPGGDILIQAGLNAAGTGTARGGNLTMRAGSPLSNNGPGGAVLIEAGDADGTNNADGGDVTINGGNAVNNQGQGGAVTITGGTTLGGITTGGPVTLKGGLGSPITGRGGLVTIEGGDGNDGGGDVEINGGLTTGTFQSRMGNVTLQAGEPTGTGGFYEAGDIFIRAGTRFNSTQNQQGGAVTISSGSTGTNNADGGAVTITAGNTNGFNQRFGGSITITAGNEEGNGSGTSEGGSIILTTGTTVSGGASRAGSVQILGSGTLELLERAAALISPAAGRGYVWLRSDTPNVLMFTDDAGSDFVIGGAGGGSDWATVLATGATSGGTSPIISNGDSIIGVDSAVADGTGFTMRGGNFTGGAGNFDGGSLIIQGGSSNGTVNGLTGGDVTIQGGAILGSAGGLTRGGHVNIFGGDTSGGSGASDGGNVNITGGTGRDIAGDVIIAGGTTSSGTGGDVTIDGGQPTAGGGNGGAIFIRSGLGEGNGDTGDITIAVPNPGGGLVAGGSVSITAGNTLTQNNPGGDVDIGAGDSSGGGAVRGGDVTLTGGDQSSGTGGRGGSVILTTGNATNTSFAAGTVTMTGPNDEDEPIAVLTTTGTNGDSVQLFVGDSDPSGSITGNAGSLFFRDTGTGGALYLNTSTGSGTTWSAVNTGGASTLQQAYVAGNTIVTDATNGALDVSGNQTISLDSTAASNFTVTGAGLTLSTATSGTLAVTSAGILDLDSGTASAVTVNSGAGSSSAGGAISVTSGAGNGAFDGGAIDITSGDSGAGATGNGGTITITAGDAASTNGDGGDIVLNPGSLAGTGTDGEVTVNGKLTVTGLIDPTGLVLTEQSAVPYSTTAGDGTLWVRDDADQTLIFTDDQGTEFEVAGGNVRRMQEITLTVQNVDRDNTGALAAGLPNGGQPGSHGENINSRIQYIEMGDSTEDDIGASWSFTLPDSYSGNGLTVEFWITGDGSASAAADMSVAVDRQETGRDLNTGGLWGAYVAATGTTLSATAWITIMATATLSNSQIDSMVAGESGRIAVMRLQSDAYTGIVRMTMARVYETP
jgi:hypothetical protein